MRSLIIASCLAAVCLYADQVTYKYDDAGRLILVDYGNGQTIAYTYDNAGNLLTRVVTAPGTSGAAAKSGASSGTATTGKNKAERRRRPR